MPPGRPQTPAAAALPYALIEAAVGLVYANALAVFQAMCDGNFL